jgi:hypothetical protein
VIITDVDELNDLPLEALWTNYIEAMDMIIECIKDKNRPAALYYMAIVKVSLDLYFDNIDQIVEQIDADETP